MKTSTKVLIAAVIIAANLGAICKMISLGEHLVVHAILTIGWQISESIDHALTTLTEKQSK